MLLFVGEVEVFGRGILALLFVPLCLGALTFSLSSKGFHSARLVLQRESAESRPGTGLNPAG